MPKSNRHIATSSDKAARILYDQRVGAVLSDKPCLEPIIMTGMGYPDPVIGGKKLPFELPVRCRKCVNCLAHRRRLWTARALHEVQAANRTWFGTLTVRPEDRFRLSLGLDLVASSDISNDLEGARKKFSILARRLSPDVTKMFKRLRADGARFRYLLVSEHHSDGFPHFHLLLHEQGEPIRKATLDAAWPLGFTKWRLVSDDVMEAKYVCKYLSKDAQTRVRASQRYGQAALISRSAECVQNALSTLLEKRSEEASPSEKRKEDK